MLNGGYDWASTLELQSTFEIKMQKAELIVDLSTMALFRALLRKCLLITRSDEPFTSASDLLPNLRTQKENVERIMREHQIAYLDYDANLKPLCEFPEGRRKE